MHFPWQGLLGEQKKSYSTTLPQELKSFNNPHEPPPQMERTSFLIIPYADSVTKHKLQLEQQYNTKIVLIYNSPSEERF